MPAASPSAREPATEIRFGQVGIAHLKLKRLDLDSLAAELADKIALAEKLFLRAPAVLDLSHLPALPDIDTVRDLLARIRGAGLLPVGLSYGTSENDALARALDLPVFAKFRAVHERIPAERTPPPAPAAEEPSCAASSPPAHEPAPEPAGGAGSLLYDKPVRSGQQVYARGRDLVLTSLVNQGAEVIADGSIHVYGALRGRALAGARGDETARIFCHEFHAELLSIAGQYRVFEDIPAELLGQPAQARLEGDRLVVARLGAGKP